MAVGDVVSGQSSIAAAAYLDIQPGAGVEWVIHNIYHEYDIELSQYDGTNTLVLILMLVLGCMLGMPSM